MVATLGPCHVPVRTAQLAFSPSLGTFDRNYRLYQLLFGSIISRSPRTLLPVDAHSETWPCILHLRLPLLPRSHLVESFLVEAWVEST